MSKGEPRLLLYDIENTPNLAYTWGKWQQDVIKFEQEWHMLSFAWKWYGEKQVNVLGLDDFPTAYRKDSSDDYHLSWQLHQLFCEADITIAHNGDSFDTRKAQARFLVHGFDPPSPVRRVDTLKVARKHFMFNSNALGDLGQTLGLGEKVETGGFKLWLGCMNGDPAAWAKMKKYNKHDVVLLEKVYEKLLPWIDTHPNMALLSDRPDACPKCGQNVNPLVARGKRVKNGAVNEYVYKNVTKYRVYQCMQCGAYSPGRIAEKTERPTYK